MNQKDPLQGPAIPWYEVVLEQVNRIATKSVGLVVAIGALYVLWDLHNKIVLLIENTGCFK